MRLLTQILILLISQIIISYSQVSLQWERTYNGPASNEDSPIKTLNDNSGNVYTIGQSKNSAQNYDYDIALVKYDSIGTFKWSSRYSNSAVNSACIDQSGSIYAAGVKYTSLTTEAPLIVKFDLNGNIMWNIQLAQSSLYRAFMDIKIDTNGNIFAAGSINDTLIILKLNSTGNIIWTAHYKNPNYTYGSIPNSLTFDNSGNIIVCGYTLVGTSNGNDALLIKFNSNGILQWVSILGQPNLNDSWGDVAADQQSNIYVTGSTQNTSFQTQSTTMKFNPQGTMIWNYTTPQNFVSWGNYLKLDAVNNIYINGFFQFSSTYWGDGFIKLNPNGALQWSRLSKSSEYTILSNDIKLDSLTNIYISESFFPLNHNLVNYTVMTKYNSNGDSLWSVRKDGLSQGSSSQTIGGSFINIDNINNIYLSTTGMGNPILNDYYTLKYSQTNYTVSGLVTYKDNNQPVSVGFVKALYYDRSTASIITVDSCEINSNGTYTLTKIPRDSVDIMYYQNDDQLDFVPTYYPSTIDWKQAVKIYATQNLTGIDGQVYRINNTTNPYNITGQCTQNTNSPLKDAIVYAKIGNEFKNYGISLSNGNYTVTKLSAGSYTLTAYRMGFNEVTQNVTITNSALTGINFNFGNPIGIQPVNDKIPTAFRLYQNYPNPFNPVTSIKFDIPKTQNVKIVIYDIMGREISLLTNEELKAGTYDVKWDASDFASGIYFYRIETNSFNETKKLMLIK